MKCFGVFVLLPLLSSTTALEVPPTWQICSRNDPQIADCVAKSFTAVLPEMKEGLKELGIPSSEPLQFGNITVEANSNSPISVAQKFIDSKVYNMTKSQIHKTEIQFIRKELQLILHCFNKYLTVEADYELRGNVVEFPVNFTGRVRLDFIDLTVLNTVRAEFYEKEGKIYIKINSFVAKIEPEKVVHKFHLDNGDEEVKAKLENLLDENWKQDWEEIRGAYEKRGAAVLKGIFDSVFGLFTADQLFPA